MDAKCPLRQVRWALKFSEFDFEIRYKRGKDNMIADYISRVITNEERISEHALEPYLLFKNDIKFKNLQPTHQGLLQPIRTSHSFEIVDIDI